MVKYCTMKPHELVTNTAYYFFTWNIIFLLLKIRKKRSVTLNKWWTYLCPRVFERFSTVNEIFLFHSSLHSLDLVMYARSCKEQSNLLDYTNGIQNRTTIHNAIYYTTQNRA